MLAFTSTAPRTSPRKHKAPVDIRHGAAVADRDRQAWNGCVVRPYDPAGHFEVWHHELDRRHLKLVGVNGIRLGHHVCGGPLPKAQNLHGVIPFPGKRLEAERTLLIRPNTLQLLADVHQSHAQDHRDSGHRLVLIIPHSTGDGEPGFEVQVEVCGHGIQGARRRPLVGSIARNQHRV